MTDHDLAMTGWKAYWKRAIRAGHAYADVSERLKRTAFPLWARECKRNAIHPGVLLMLLVGAVIVTVFTGSVIPLLVLMVLYVFLVIRSAYKARWKSKEPMTLLLYGIHSHLQQIPIAWGQITYWWNRFRKTRQHLIEYK
jgi:hypothetical protein